MTSIHDVPEEILFETFLHLAYDRTSLRQLALVSHRFWRTARQVLFRNVDVHGLAYSSHDVSRRLCLLRRAFEEDPELTRSVQSCGPMTALKCSASSSPSYGTDDDSIPGDTQQEIDDTVFRMTESTFSMVSKFVNLKRITFMPESCTPSTPDLIPVTDLPNFKQISDVFIRAMDVDMLPVLLSMPKIRSISTEIVCMSRRPGPRLRLCDGSSLRKLELEGDYTPLQTYKLADILSSCSQLKILKCNCNLFTSENEEIGWEDGVSSVNLAQCLQSVSTTLEELEMVLPIEGSTDVAGYGIDLSSFSMLRQIRLSAGLVFGHDGPFWSPNVYQRLPQSIEVLKVRFREYIRLYMSLNFL